MYTPAFATFVQKNGKDNALAQSSVRPVSARTYRKSTSSARPGAIQSTKRDLSV